METFPLRNSVDRLKARETSPSGKTKTDLIDLTQVTQQVQPENVAQLF